MLITKLAFSKYKMSNFAIFLYDLLPFVCESMLLLFFLDMCCFYFYGFTMVLLFSEYSIIKLGLDGIALVNAINSKVGIMNRAVKQERIRRSSLYP